MLGKEAEEEQFIDIIAEPQPEQPKGAVLKA
jgi:hypothetical protein